LYINRKQDYATTLLSVGHSPFVFVKPLRGLYSVINRFSIDMDALTGKLKKPSAEADGNGCKKSPCGTFHAFALRNDRQEDLQGIAGQARYDKQEAAMTDKKPAMTRANARNFHRFIIV
jgi:hypothetical protein